MIYITPTISINENEIKFDFTHSSGPGGQNVNKVASVAQLRFDVKNSKAFPDDVRARLIQLAGKKITGAGVLLIKAGRFRKQELNRKDSVSRLISLIRKASKKPKIRVKTRPTVASKKRRLAIKKHRSKIKKMRLTAGKSLDN